MAKHGCGAGGRARERGVNCRSTGPGRIADRLHTSSTDFGSDLHNAATLPPPIQPTGVHPFSGGSIARTARTSTETLMPVHRSTSPTPIDEQPNEDVWTAAPAATNVVPWETIEGAPPQHRTEVRVFNDEQALHVGARMYDDSPDAPGSWCGAVRWGSSISFSSRSTPTPISARATSLKSRQPAFRVTPVSSTTAPNSCPVPGLPYPGIGHRQKETPPGESRQLSAVPVQRAHRWLGHASFL
jgi:hypothetical protein